MVLETAALSEIELSEYCRRKGLYPEQVQAWRQACISGQQSAQAQRQAEREQAKADKSASANWARAAALGRGAGRSGGDPEVLRKSSMPTGETTAGQLTSLPERQQFVDWLNEAVAAGARKNAACKELGVSLRTLQRWTEDDAMQADARTTHGATEAAQRAEPGRARGDPDAVQQPEHAHLPPSQIVPRLADQGAIWPRVDLLPCPARRRPATPSRSQSAARTVRRRPAMWPPQPTRCGRGISPTCRARCVGDTTPVA